ARHDPARRARALGAHRRPRGLRGGRRPLPRAAAVAPLNRGAPVPDESSETVLVPHDARFRSVLGPFHTGVTHIPALHRHDRFGQTPWRVGVSGAPVLEEAIAYLDCRFEAEYPGGDHKIIVGRVLDLDMREGARPLLFFKGGYERMHEG